MTTTLEWNAENPFPFYQEMRTTKPIYKDSSHRWNVFLHEDVKRVLSDGEQFSSQISFQPMSLLFMDSPEHQKYRSHFSKAMTPQLMGRLSAGIETTARESIREFVEQDKVDVVESLSLRVPLEVITQLLGILPEDRDQFKEWAKFVFWHHSELDQSIGEEELMLKLEKGNEDLEEVPLTDD